MQPYIDKEIEPPLPELEEASYLARLFQEAGVVLQTGLGISPLPWTELESWIKLSGLHLDYWELLTLKEMSYAYASELSRASDPKRTAPYAEIRVEPAANLDDKFRNIFKAINNRKKRG